MVGKIVLLSGRGDKIIILRRRKEAAVTLQCPALGAVIQHCI